MSGIFQKLPTQLKKPLGRGGERSLQTHQYSCILSPQLIWDVDHSYLSRKLPR